MKILLILITIFGGVGLYLKFVAFPIFDSGIIAKIIDNEICEKSLIAKIILLSIAVLLTLLIFPGGIWAVTFLVLSMSSKVLS